ncbi:MAG: hypothetical protein MZV70_53870 [Desulfobacterales bacterium]|nr:hypothetical protein [Desulfobacterales bacterium]
MAFAETKTFVKEDAYTAGEDYEAAIRDYGKAIKRHPKITWLITIAGLLTVNLKNIMKLLLISTKPFD